MKEKHSEYLKYTFSESELREHAKDLARENTVASEAEEQKKAVVAQFTEKVASAKTKISMLSRYINNGYDHRSVECETTLDMPEKGIARVVRLDTGEVVRERAMTPSELQIKLPLKESK